MRNLFRMLNIGLSNTGVALVLTSGWRNRTTVLATARITQDDMASGSDTLPHLRRALQEANCRKAVTKIILSDDMVRLFMVSPPRNASCLDDCRAAAAMRFQALYGEPISDWSLKADWDANHAFLACALPRSVEMSLHQMMLDAHLKVVSIVPQFIAAHSQYRSRLQPNTWFGVVYDGVLTLGLHHQGRLIDVRMAPLQRSEFMTGEWLGEYARREALRLGVPAPTVIQLCGTVPDTWLAQSADGPICMRLYGAAENKTVQNAENEVALAMHGVRL